MTQLKISWQNNWGMIAQFFGDNADSYEKFIGGVLWADFKEAEWCEIVLERIGQVEKGELLKSDWEGNSWQVDFDKDQVLISFQLEPEHRHSFLTIVFRKCLCAWRDFLLYEDKIHREILLQLD